MIQFLNIDNFIKDLTPVLTTEFFARMGDFHPEGLFSEQIFGAKESKERKKTFSYINLNSKVIHPSALKILMQLDRKVEKFISATESFSLDKDKALQIDKNGVTGLKAFIKLFPKIKFRGDSDKREKYIKKLNESFKNNLLFIEYMPVIPPIQRDIYQDENNMWIHDKLNDYYISLLRKSFHIRSTSKEGPLFDLLNFEVQKSVIEHDDYIRTLIQKKRGLIRSQLLGKRTDFSWRAVITPGPDLKVNEIGLPVRLCVDLFEPFLIHRLLYSGIIDKKILEKEIKDFLGLELSVESVKTVIKNIKSADEIPESLFKIFFDAVEICMRGRVVIAKRDPCLQRGSVQAFYPKLIKGNTIHLCTLIVGGMNADFDGDQISVFHPITKESQQEIQRTMMKVEGVSTFNSMSFSLSKEMCAGLFIITKDIKRTGSPIYVNDEDLGKATDPYIPVKYRNKNTTMGKAIFNSYFPPDFPFYDKVVTKKIVNDMIPLIVEKYGQKKALEVFSNLEKAGFKWATIMSPGISLDDIEIPESILKLKQKLEGSSTEEADDILKKMLVLLKKHLKDTGLGDLVESGATKGWAQPFQILVSKGLIADPSGNVLPVIKGSFADGFTNKEYFAASAGARRGIINRTISTADTGYLSRQLAFVLNSVEIHPHLKDCGTKLTLDLRLTKDMIFRLNGRYILVNDKVELFDPKEKKPGDVIYLRTPIFCKSPKICHVCYGRLLEKHRSPFAGIISAQIVGESSTQSSLRDFHTGGAVEIFKRDIIEDILQNDPLIELEK